MFYILLHGCLNNSFISEQSIKVNQLQLQKEQQHPYSAEHVRSRQKNPIREYESYVRCSIDVFMSIELAKAQKCYLFVHLSNLFFSIY